MKEASFDLRVDRRSPYGLTDIERWQVARNYFDMKSAYIISGCKKQRCFDIVRACLSVRETSAAAICSSVMGS